MKHTHFVKSIFSYSQTPNMPDLRYNQMNDQGTQYTTNAIRNNEVNNMNFISL